MLIIKYEIYDFRKLHNYFYKIFFHKRKYFLLFLFYFPHLTPCGFSFPRPLFTLAFSTPSALEETLHFQAVFSFCKSNSAPYFSKAPPPSPT